MTQKKIETIDIDETLRKLEEISLWFERQKEPNIEEGLKKVEESARLIEESRRRFGEIENRFETIEKRIKRKVA